MTGLSRRGFLGGVAVGAMAGALPAAAEPEVPEAAKDLGFPVRELMRTDRQWSQFLAGQDLVWKRMPRTWYEGPFLGNGFLAAAVYREPGANSLRFKVDHAQVQDHRPAFGNEWGVARLPVGRANLTPVGTITGVDLRLDLWNAELRGTITTDRGELALRAFVHSDRSLLSITVEPTSGERDFTLTFTPAEALSPRTIREDPPAAFVRNPPPVTRTEGDITVVVQPMVAGGQTATAYRERRRGHGQTAFVLSVAHSFPEVTAEHAVLSAVRQVSAFTTAALEREHQHWWHSFYRRSFLSVPDALVQSFYWIQLYKYGCAARAQAPVLPTTGPWLEPTPWPSVWWNLNAQLEYWALYGSNHVDLDPIARTLKTHQQLLIDALRPQFRHDSAGLRRSTDGQFADAGFVGAPGFSSPDPEIGDLPWLLHNVWLAYRHTMDESLLREVLFPLLRRAMNYYLHFLSPGPDGRLHLAPTYSPEYGTAPDCNYDLALIRWSCQTLLESARLLKLTDPLALKWREVLNTLVDYPVDAKGFMIGAGVPFAKSHRHYSHLLAVYPLYLVNGENPQQRELIERSLKHWISFEGALRGYSFTGAASISAQLGKGNDALGYLRELVARFIQPNTMYYEAGPVIETPLSGAQSVHDLLCTSWGGLIRIFPAVPDEWKDVALQDFRTEGAFLVSASRKGGVTQFVRIRSLAGQPCRVRTGIAGPLTVRGRFGSRPRWRDCGDGSIEIDLRRDQDVVVYAAETRPDFTLGPVPTSRPAPRWGLPALPPQGAAVPVDLGGQLNHDAITSEFYLGDGDFDGTGRTYPAAQLPQTGQLTDDGIPFLFSNGSEGTPNNVLAAGQTIELPAGRYLRLHLLGASDNGDTNTTARLGYADGSTAEVTLALTDWLSAPNFGESEAIRTNQVHTRKGPTAVKAAIFHQRIAVDPARELRSITLPAVTRPRPHLFAITLEQQRT